MIICPRCGQDYLVEAVIKPLKEEVLICPECEAFWTDDTPVRADTFRDFGDYLENNGLPWDWRLLDIRDGEQKLHGN